MINTGTHVIQATAFTRKVPGKSPLAINWGATLIHTRRILSAGHKTIISLAGSGGYYQTSLSEQIDLAGFNLTAAEKYGSGVQVLVAAGRTLPDTAELVEMIGGHPNLGGLLLIPMADPHWDRSGDRLVEFYRQIGELGVPFLIYVKDSVLTLDTLLRIRAATNMFVGLKMADPSRVIDTPTWASILGADFQVFCGLGDMNTDWRRKYGHVGHTSFCANAYPFLVRKIDLLVRVGNWDAAELLLGPLRLLEAERFYKNVQYNNALVAALVWGIEHGEQRPPNPLVTAAHLERLLPVTSQLDRLEATAANEIGLNVVRASHG